jgi:hypothetical protein
MKKIKDYIGCGFIMITAIGSTEGANQKMAILGHFGFARPICP